MSRATEVLISLPALRHNLLRAASLAPASRLWAVVKADAYGHGLAAVLPALERADGLALVEFDAAIALREAGWTKPVLLLEGAFDQEDTMLAAGRRLELVVHEQRQIDWLERVPARKTVNVHLKFNSGMNRLGFSALEFVRAHKRLRELAGVGTITLMTHFANADVPAGADAAIASFEAVTRDLPGPRSLANSAAVFGLPQVHGDWVRPGIMLYGATPIADRSARSLGLEPVMCLQSRLIAVQHLSPGDTVGYGSTFVAKQAMRIGIVACGYADGYPRHAPTGTPVAVAGHRTRTLGRVSMDMLAVDLEQVPNASVGDTVQLFGDQIPVDDVAACAGTIGYELLCAIAPRVRRVVVHHG